ncbi:MAG: thermonuclease family protein [Pyrinomonadaceae bacterium]
MTIKAAQWCFAVAAFCTPLHAQDAKSATTERNESSAKTQVSSVLLVEGNVVSVETGDTISIQTAGKYHLVVKLQAIDAPDLGQSHFEESRNRLSELINGRGVQVAVHSTGPSGRIIGTVYYKGRDVSLGLLEKGLVWHYTRFPYQQTPTNQKVYSDAQKAATAAGIGIWAESNPVPPWVYRGEALLDKQADSNRYERTYLLGPRGGCYYVAESGRRVYVRDKQRCAGITARNETLKQ